MITTFTKTTLADWTMRAMGEMEDVAEELREAGMRDEATDAYRLLNEIGALRQKIQQSNEDVS